MTAGDDLLWVVFPYAASGVFVVGHLLRQRCDQFGGHVVGLVNPKPWLEFFGVTEHVHHLGATGLDSFTAASTVAGLAVLIYRRSLTKRVPLVTMVMDKVVHPFGARVLCPAWLPQAPRPGLPFAGCPPRCRVAGAPPRLGEERAPARALAEGGHWEHVGTEYPQE
ncbi:hypothetical protein RCH23_001822 [Cryobacterium sp. CAN_C3]|nr:hypothetical protein [Cryobacterium sp. CAN_C3]